MFHALHVLLPAGPNNEISVVASFYTNGITGKCLFHEQYIPRTLPGRGGGRAHSANTSTPLDVPYTPLPLNFQRFGYSYTYMYIMTNVQILMSQLYLPASH